MSHIPSRVQHYQVNLEVPHKRISQPPPANFQPTRCGAMRLRNSIELMIFGILPKLGEMELVTRHQVVSMGSVSAFHEDVVIWVRGDLSHARWHDNASMILD